MAKTITSDLSQYTENKYLENIMKNINDTNNMGTVEWIKHNEKVILIYSKNKNYKLSGGIIIDDCNNWSKIFHTKFSKTTIISQNNMEDNANNIGNGMIQLINLSSIKLMINFIVSYSM